MKSRRIMSIEVTDQNLPGLDLKAMKVTFKCGHIVTVAANGPNKRLFREGTNVHCYSCRPAPVFAPLYSTKS